MGSRRTKPNMAFHAGQSSFPGARCPSPQHLQLPRTQGQLSDSPLEKDCGGAFRFVVMKKRDVLFTKQNISLVQGLLPPAFFGQRQQMNKSVLTAETNASFQERGR